MRVTERTKRDLAYRREQRDLPKAGWEYVGDRGGPIWELHRGYRYTQRILDVRIACDGKGLWIKIGKPA